MQKYIKDYLISRGLDRYMDTVVCEVCKHYGKRTQAVDVHHTTQSYRGSRQHDPDGSDLIALCREHHNWIHSHNTQENKELLLSIIKDNIVNHKQQE